MNKILFVSVSLLVFSCSSPGEENKTAETQKDSAVKITLKADSTAPPVINGEYVKRYPNGIIEMKGNYKEGKRNGMWQSWYPDGKLWSETSFKMGIKHGPTFTFYENGKMRYEGFYKDDQRAGKWKLYDTTGKFVKEADYSKPQK